MQNPIRNWLKKRQQKKAQHQHLLQLSNLANIFSTYDKLEQSNMLHFDITARRLFIEQPLAYLMMTNADTWSNFLKGVHLWQYDRECRRAWDNYIQQEEIDAINAALKQQGKLTAADRQRIRRACREQIARSDVQPPAVEPYEYFIIRDTATTTAQTADILAVGHYSPADGLVEIASWDTVSRFLSAS